METIFDSLWPVAILVIGSGLGWGLARLKDFVASTATTKDDEALKAVLDAINKAFNNTPTPPVV